jgi:hypothetical protein
MRFVVAMLGSGGLFTGEIFRVLATERVSGKGRSCCSTKRTVDAVDLSRTRSVGLCGSSREVSSQVQPR